MKVIYLWRGDKRAIWNPTEQRLILHLVIDGPSPKLQMAGNICFESDSALCMKTLLCHRQIISGFHALLWVSMGASCRVRQVTPTVGGTHTDDATGCWRGSAEMKRQNIKWGEGKKTGRENGYWERNWIQYPMLQKLRFWTCFQDWVC